MASSQDVFSRMRPSTLVDFIAGMDEDAAFDQAISEAQS